MVAFKCDELWLVTFTLCSVTLVIVYYSDTLWQKLLKLTEEKYGCEKPVYPTQIHSFCKELRKEMMNFVETHSYHVCEVPSFHGKLKMNVFIAVKFFSIPVQMYMMEKGYKKAATFIQLMSPSMHSSTKPTSNPFFLYKLQALRFTISYLSTICIISVNCLFKIIYFWYFFQIIPSQSHNQIGLSCHFSVKLMNWTQLTRTLYLLVYTRIISLITRIPT